MSSFEKNISTGERTIAGDVDALVGLQLTSNGQHKIQVMQHAWVPWLVFSDQWNAANSYNLSLLSDLAYRSQKARNDGVPVDSESKDIFNFFRDDLAQKKSRIYPDGDFPLLTRSVRRGDHFQDLRFWDAGVIQPDGSGNSDPQAFAVRSRDQILISVRGTSELVDWLSDARFAMRPFTEGPRPANTATERPLQVHTGFHENFGILKPHIDAYLGEHLALDTPIDGRTQRDVILCGHSLGGATALLLAAYIRSHYSPRVMLYTYGMPRVGEEPFAAHYDPETGTEPIYHFRHVHHQDLVTRVPPRWGSHPMVELLLTQNSSPGLIETLDGDRVPYAHHGHLVYLPPSSNPVSVPTLSYRLTDLVNFEEYFVPGIDQEGVVNRAISKISGAFTDEDEALNNEDHDLYVRNAREKESMYWLTAYADVNAASHHASERQWNRVVSEITEALGKGMLHYIPNANAIQETAHRILDHFMVEYSEVVRRGLVKQIESVLDEEGTLAEQIYNRQTERQRLTQRIRRIQEDLDTELELRRLQRLPDVETRIRSRGHYRNEFGVQAAEGTVVIVLDVAKVDNDVLVMLDATSLFESSRSNTARADTVGADESPIRWVRVSAEQVRAAQAEAGAEEARIVLLLDDAGSDHRTSGPLADAGSMPKDASMPEDARPIPESAEDPTSMDGLGGMFATQPGVVFKRIGMPGLSGVIPVGHPVTPEHVTVDAYEYDAARRFVLNEHGALAAPRHEDAEADIERLSNRISEFRSMLEDEREALHRQTLSTAEIRIEKGNYYRKHGPLNMGEGTVVVDVDLPTDWLQRTGQPAFTDVFVCVDPSPLVEDARPTWIRVTAAQLRAARQEVRQEGQADVGTEPVTLTVLLDESTCPTDTPVGREYQCKQVFADQPGVVMKHATVPGLADAIPYGERLGPGDVRASVYLYDADARLEHLDRINELREQLAEAVNQRTALYPYEDLFDYLPPLRAYEDSDPAETSRQVFRSFLDEISEAEQEK